MVMGRTWRQLFLAAVLVAGCHVVLPLSSRGNDGISEDREAPDLPTVVDLALLSDLPLDTAVPGDLPRDAAPDAGQDLCESPQPVNNMLSDTGQKISLVEPALMPDGNTLLAREDQTTTHWVATRPGPSGAFGPWQKWSGWLFGDWEDPSFFRRGGTDYAIVARSVRGGSRWLERCDPAGTCDKLSFTGLAPGLDLDGPDIRAGVGGPEELVLAAGGELYLATATDPKGPWSAAPITKVNGVKLDDDPAISAEGLWLVFGSDRAGSMDLLVATRAPGADFELLWLPLQLAFGSSVNSPREDAAPDLAPMASGVGLELFFHSDRGESGGPGPFTIYRASCELK
jgi:hypothetical protein